MCGKLWKFAPGLSTGKPFATVESMDHEDQAAAVERDIFRAMSPERKYETLMELRRFAWELKAAAIRDLHPELTSEQINRRVAEVFIRAST